MKLRTGWKSHGRCWHYMESPSGFADEAVIQYTECGQKRYEAHYYEEKCCGFANSPSDFRKIKKFDDREAAFLFCEEKYRQRMQAEA